MSVEKFIPKIWSARLLSHLDKAHVYANLMNRDYQGDISNAGDSVVINQLGNISVKKYARNTDISDPELLSTTDQMLVIDQENYFNFQIDDVDAAQIAGTLMESAMQRSAYALAEESDLYAASLLAKGTLNTGLGTDSTPITLNKDNAYDQLVAMKVLLDKKNVPKQGRWVVVPPEFEGFMLLDPRFASAYGSNAEGRLVEGLVARAAGFDIYVSNNVPNTSGDKYKIIASYNDSASYAEQIVKTEAYRMEKRFADAVKGLHVYGAKVTRPGEVAVLTATFKEEAI